MIGVQNPWRAKNGRNESSEPRVAPMSGGELAWIAGCIAFASFAQTLSGFGFSLMAVPLMTLVVSPRDAVVVATIIGAISTTSQAVIDRKHVDSSIAKRLILASYAGMPFGLMAFIFVSETGLRLVLGVVVISASILLLRGFRLRDDSHHLDWVFGIISGFLSTSTSTNGPPLVFLMQAQKCALPARRLISQIGSQILLSIQNWLLVQEQISPSWFLQNKNHLQNFRLFITRGHCISMHQKR